MRVTNQTSLLGGQCWMAPAECSCSHALPPWLDWTLFSKVQLCLEPELGSEWSFRVCGGCFTLLPAHSLLPTAAIPSPQIGEPLLLVSFPLYLQWK